MDATLLHFDANAIKHKTLHITWFREKIGWREESDENGLKSRRG